MSTTKPKSKWKHIGDGCHLASDMKYPCDDSYENQETGEVVTLYSTYSAHRDMPFSTDDVYKLLNIRLGVVKTR